MAFCLGLSPLLQAQSPDTAAVPREAANLAQAIRFPTVSQSDRSAIDYPAFVDFRAFLQATYPAVFSQLELQLIGGHSLLLRWPGRQPERLPVLFDSHYDVVPVEPGTEAHWQHPPFAGVISEGYVWGRGALDDKVSAIATLEALARLLADGFVPERTLYFSLVHDEEIGGQDGAANVAAALRQAGVKLDYLVMEGGVLVTDNPFVPGRPLALINVAEKTYVTLRLRARGAGGHSSMPVADNSIVRLARAVQALHDNPFPARLAPPVTDMLQALGQEAGGVKGWLLRNLWLSGPLVARQLAADPQRQGFVRDTTAVTRFNAGIKDNVFPQLAEALVNFRLLPDTAPEQLVASVAALVNDPAIEIDIVSDKGRASVSDSDSAAFKQLSAAIRQVRPEALVVPGLMMATSDSPHYAGLAGNIYRFHPYSVSTEQIKGVHGTNERVSVASVVESVRLFDAMIRAAAR